MRIIVCGAGKVGTSIARQLANEGNDVTVIEQSPELIDRISETLDVQAKLGFASHPTILREVDATSADMIIAVTLSDEVNMVACQVAHSLFNIPLKIARIRHPNYLQPEWNDLYRHDHLPIDFIISPEIEVAKAMLHRLHVPGASDTIPFANGQIKVISTRCTMDCPILNITLMKLQEQLEIYNVSVMGIIRNGDFIFAEGKIVLLEDDELYLCCNTEYVPKVMTILGHGEKEAQRIVIIGGGNIGCYLASCLEKENSRTKIKLIEVDKLRAEKVADKLDRSTVINGNALAKDILEEANIAYADTCVAVSNDDEVNILSSLLAKRFGCQRVITLITDSPSYAPLISSLGIDVAVDPREITISSILQHIRKGRIIGVHSICSGKAEIIEAEATESSPLTGKQLSNLDLPHGIMIIAIMRDKTMLVPQAETIVKAGDRIIILAKANIVKRVEKLFTVGFEFF